MDTTETQILPAPPSLVRSLIGGFDCISNHIVLILFPAILDLLLWFGPHLRLQPLVQALINAAPVSDLPPSPDLSSMVKASQEFWQLFGDHFNLFSLLRSFPVGVPSLMVSMLPIQSPLGTPVHWEIDSIIIAFIAWVGISLAGILVGALYFAFVAQATLFPETSWEATLRRWPKAAIQTLALTILWIILLLVVTLPFSCLLTLLLLFGINLGQIAVLLFGSVLAWLLLPLFFAPHGIYARGRNVLAAARESIRLTRFTFPTTLLLLVCVLVINEGLGLLWKAPAETSWWLLVGVAGHAFISSSLLAATFIFYQDADRWVQGLGQQTKLSQK